MARRLTKYGEYSHGHTLLGDLILIDDDGLPYLSIKPLRPSTVVITSHTVTDSAWATLASGLVGVLKWKISEYNGNDILYTFEAVPGDNYSVAFGWAGDETAITEIYARSKSGNITVKLEIWYA